MTVPVEASADDVPAPFIPSLINVLEVPIYVFVTPGSATSTWLPSLDIIINPSFDLLPNVTLSFPILKACIVSFSRVPILAYTLPLALTGTPRSLVGLIPALCPDWTNTPTAPSTRFASFPERFPAVCAAPVEDVAVPICAFRSISP